MQQSYKCMATGTPSASNEATLVCFQQHCQQHAFMCGQEHCLCMTNHSCHQNQTVNALLSHIKQLPVSEEVIRTHRSLQQMLEQLSKVVDHLRTKIRQHIKQCEVAFTNSQLLEDIRGATGHQVWALLRNINGAAESECPSTSLMEKDLQLVKRNLEGMLHKLSELPERIQPILEPLQTLLPAKPKEYYSETTAFVFSETDKHPSIMLHNFHKKASRSNHISGFHHIAMIEPALHLAGPQRIRILIGKCAGFLGVGICVRETVVANKFDCYIQQPNRYGVHINTNEGRVFSDSSAQDTDSSKGIRFKSGETVTVEFDPTSNTITYQGKEGQRWVQNTNIGEKRDKDIHFCGVLTVAGDELTIIEPGLASAK